MTSVNHGSSEIKRSQKESTFYYYNISWGLNIFADLGLSHDWVWCLIAWDDKKPEFRSSPGTGSLPHCELALAGFSPSPKCINLFSAGWMAPALGLPVLHIDPHPHCSPGQPGYVCLWKTPPSSKVQKSERRHTLTSARFNSSPNLIHHTKLESADCAHR